MRTVWATISARGLGTAFEAFTAFMAFTAFAAADAIEETVDPDARVITKAMTSPLYEYLLPMSPLYHSNADRVSLLPQAGGK